MKILNFSEEAGSVSLKKLLSFFTALILIIVTVYGFKIRLAQAAFPSIETTETTVTSGTNHTVNLPSGISSGDLLIANTTTVADTTIGGYSGWTQLDQDNIGFDATVGVFYKRADGSEGSTVTVTTSGSVSAMHAIYRISGHHASSDPEISTFAQGSPDPYDPPSVTASWGAEDNLFIIALGIFNDGGSGVSTYPSGYTGSQLNVVDGNGNAAVLATRELAAAADDPGTGDISAGEQLWGVYTIVVRPAEEEPEPDPSTEPHVKVRGGSGGGEVKVRGGSGGGSVKFRLDAILQKYFDRLDKKPLTELSFSAIMK